MSLLRGCAGTWSMFQGNSLIVSLQHHPTVEIFLMTLATYFLQLSDVIVYY